MHKSRSLLKSSFYRRKLGEKLEASRRKLWRIVHTRTCIILTVFSLLLSFCGSVDADYVMPTPPKEIVITETCISIALTTPANTIFINVTEYAAYQIVKNVTVEFLEPVTYIGFTIEVLSDSPNYEDLPRNKTVFQRYNDTILQYYTIRFLTEPADKITNVTMVFAIEKVVAQERDGEVTLVLYRYDGRNMEEFSAEKFGEDDVFLYFRTTTEGSAYIAITRVLIPAPWWAVVIIIAIIALMAVVGIYLYRRFNLVNLKKW